MNALVRVSEFDFTLPPELIASCSVEPRDQARMFVHNRGDRQSHHKLVADLPDFLGHEQERERQTDGNMKQE